MWNPIKLERTEPIKLGRTAGHFILLRRNSSLIKPSLLGLMNEVNDMVEALINRSYFHSFTIVCIQPFHVLVLNF